MDSGSSQTKFSPVRRAIKRLADIVISLLSLVLLSPLMLYVAIRVRLSSPGPVLYSQERVGYRGRIFRIRKFRSMYVDAEVAGPQLSPWNDPRITPWGRTMRHWKLDELPQFWNVLVGEMSVVGPRPERPFYAAQMNERSAVYRTLLGIKPGITSLGMVRYGYASNIDEMMLRMKYDLQYLENSSLASDVSIMLSTLRIIFGARKR